MELLGPRPVLLLAAVFPAGVAATAFMITEHRVDGLRKHAHEGQRAVVDPVTGAQHPMERCTYINGQHTSVVRETSGCAFRCTHQATLKLCTVACWWHMRPEACITVLWLCYRRAGGG